MPKLLCVLLSVAIAAAHAVAGAETLTSGKLEMTVEALPEGLHVAGLRDTATGTSLLAQRAVPLFAITMKKAGETVKVNADAGWSQVAVTPGFAALSMAWASPKDTRLAGLSVKVQARAVAAENAIQWAIEATPADGWSIWDVAFPQAAVGALGEHTAFLFPRGPGEIKVDPWEQPFQYSGRYAGGWTSMQFFAAYAEGAEPGPGLYFAHHDPMGSVKEMILESDKETRSVRITFEYDAPDCGKSVPFQLSGTAVWRLFRGDWYDAASIYRDWVKAEARWWPALAEEGRADTAQWMRELCAWAQTGGTPEEVSAQVKDLAAWLGVPVGFHWYSWHQIPFDNDYPHYFPAKDGFAEAVRDLQANNVHVMPYINGRLWDTRDKGAEDFEFSSVAKPAVTKDETGAPFIEKYGSKEADGSPVALGVMCPTTPLWQNTVKDIVLRLQNEMGVDGVYIDQIAAASPVLCMDATHGHPLGGGAWWNEGYWTLLDALRREMQPGRMITTECNGEPFINKFDGYLTWHWQYDGQVPAFPAVYGGTIQMFGRAYGGGETADLAMRMKAAQQLVFGEQIGWLSPPALRAMPSAEFFRKAVLLRHALRRYFYAGEMARPPRLRGDIPKVKADWQWSGEWWVTTDAVLTGAWRLPGEKRAVLIFANVSDAPVTAEFTLNPAEYELPDEGVTVKSIEVEGATVVAPPVAGVATSVTFPQNAVSAWELIDK